MHGLHLFCDSRPNLSPLTDLRPSFALRTGAMTTKERLVTTLGLPLLGLHVKDPLIADITSETHGEPVNQPVKSSALHINGRLALANRDLLALQPGEGVIEEQSGDLVAAHLSADDANTLYQGSTPQLNKVRSCPSGTLINRPWHIRTFRDACLAHDLAWLLKGTSDQMLDARSSPPAATHAFGQHAVMYHRTSHISPTTIFDSSGGPIVIDARANIRPRALLIGPCYVGQDSTVLDLATIRPGTCIGPHCKVNGEVGGTIFQSFSNKAHDGYVGDSYLGEWVNLGAGTTTSNLLNTYSEVIVKATPKGSHERTGQTFLGSIIGDHTKTAICTRLMTGTIIHTGSMIATTSGASGCVAPFSWMTDDGVRQFRLEKFIEVLKAAMARRAQTPSPAYLSRVKDLHARTTTTNLS